jgi:hypothetical protein
MRTTWTLAGRAAALLLGLTLLLAPLSAGARDDHEPEHTAHTGLVGIGAGLATLVYAPLKLTYALTGSVMSGLVWLLTFGDSDVAGPIFKRSIRGDYVVAPDQLTGRHALVFVGRRY